MKAGQPRLETLSTLANEQTHPAEMSEFQLEGNIKVTDLFEASSHAHALCHVGYGL